jgi:hypothetical protein
VSPIRGPGASRSRGPAIVLLLLVACSAFEPTLSKQVRKENSFRLIEDDGRSAVWSVRSLAPQDSREWLRLLAGERKRIEDFFATVVPGRISLWLVDVLPERFEGDAFSEGSDIFLRMGRAGSPSAGDGTLVAHEMTHVVLLEAFGIARPFWFEEGLATYLEGQRLGYGVGGRDMLSGVAGISGIDVAALTLENVEHVEKPLGYRLSAAAIELILEKHGFAAMRRLQRERSGQRFGDAYCRVTGETLEALEGRWREEIRTASRLEAFR